MIENNAFVRGVGFLLNIDYVYLTNMQRHRESVVGDGH